MANDNINSQYIYINSFYQWLIRKQRATFLFGGLFRKQIQEKRGLTNIF
jgi:hypothetical protein